MLKLVCRREQKGKFILDCFVWSNCFSSITERELESALLLINLRLINQHHVNPLFICVAYTNVDCY